MILKFPLLLTQRSLSGNIVSGVVLHSRCFTNILSFRILSRCSDESRKSYFKASTFEKSGSRNVHEETSFLANRHSFLFASPFYSQIQVVISEKGFAVAKFPSEEWSGVKIENRLGRDTIFMFLYNWSLIHQIAFYRRKSKNLWEVCRLLRHLGSWHFTFLHTPFRRPLHKLGTLPSSKSSQHVRTLMLRQSQLGSRDTRRFHCQFFSQLV